MSTDFAVGIDLGTSTSEIAVYRNGKPETLTDPINRLSVIPSIVACNDRGEILVGSEALDFVDLPGRGVREVKRLMGSAESVMLNGQEFRPEEISAHILNHLREIAEVSLGTRVQDVVLTVPANFPDSARAATKAAAEIAGLNVLRLINEPTAAALAYGIENMEAEEQLLVFDFGGGTLDVSILEFFDGIMEVVASYGDTQLGGKDIDDCIRTFCEEEFVANHSGSSTPGGGAHLKKEAENAKKALSFKSHTTVALSNYATIKGKPVRLEVNVSRQQFEELVEPIVTRARRVVQKALKAKKVRPSDIQRVLLVGGSTYVPAMQKMLTEIFGRKPELPINPDLAVSSGACIQAAMLKGLISQSEGILLTDVSPFGLGIDIVSVIGGQVQVVYDALMPPNTAIPFSVKKEYSLVSDSQEALSLSLYQDHTGRGQTLNDVVFTGLEGTIDDLPPSRSGIPHQVEVEFSYNLDGNAVLTARIPAIHRDVRIRFTDSELRMNAGDKARAQARMRELRAGADTPQQAPDPVFDPSQTGRFEAIVRKAMSALEALPENQASKLKQALENIERACASGSQTDLEITGEKLIDLMFDLESEY